MAEKIQGLTALNELIKKIGAAYGAAYKIVDVTATEWSITPAWHTWYRLTANPTSITFTSPAASDASKRPAEVKVTFTTGTTAPTVTFPDTWLWADGEVPTIDASTTYELNIAYDGMGNITVLCCGFSAAA